MKQFSFSREKMKGSGDLDQIARALNIKWEYVENNMEKSWNLYVTRIIDALTLWCKDSGIVNFATGYTQIAIQITFLENKDAIYFKLRWHDAQA